MTDRSAQPARGYRRVVRALRRATEPGPEGFTWSGVRFSPVEGRARVWASEPIDLDDRSADWRVEQPIAGSGWHARLKIGADRFPGVGKSAAEALEGAAAEAQNVAALIVAMLPAASSPAPRRSKRTRRASGVRR